MTGCPPSQAVLDGKPPTGLHVLRIGRLLLGLVQMGLEAIFPFFFFAFLRFFLLFLVFLLGQEPTTAVFSWKTGTFTPTPSSPTLFRTSQKKWSKDVAPSQLPLKHSSKRTLHRVPLTGWHVLRNGEKLSPFWGCPLKHAMREFNLGRGHRGLYRVLVASEKGT